MRWLVPALLSALLFTACRRPEIAAFGRHPDPIVVAFEVSPDGPRADSVKDEYAAALRAELATCTTVVPDGTEAPEPSAELKVMVTRIRPHGDPPPAAVGTAAGVAVGTLSLMAGDRDAFLNGLFWGLWAGSAAAGSQDWDRHRLGYGPVRVNAVVALRRSGEADPLMEFSIGGGEVVERMESLPPDLRNDPARIREEEAKAFAKVVVERLQERFHWLPLPEPSYYEPAVAQSP